MSRARGGVLLVLLLFAPLAAEGQEYKAEKVYHVGLLFLQDRSATPYPVLLRDRLRDLGYREGQEIIIEERFVAGNPEQLPALVADLVRRRVDLIVTWLDHETLAAQRATDSIPIVVLASADPVGNRFVASLARPGGNITGLTFDAGFEVASKRIEILRDVTPNLRSVGFLFNPEYPGMTPYVRIWKAATASLGLKFQAFEARESQEIVAALAKIKQARPDALFVGGGWPLIGGDIRQRIVDFAIESRLPATFITEGWIRIGGLIAYLASDQDRARRAAILIDKILKGAKPADLPVEQPTKFELVINLKTAKALGMTIPPSLLLRADQLLE